MIKNKLSVVIDGQDKTVTTEIIDKKIWFKLDEQTFSFDLLGLNETNYKKVNSLSKSPEKILAPMPGKIIKVFVSENQTVRKGDTLLVMEAMKMEYTLKADIDASVEKIFYKVTEQVTLGNLLIQLQAIK